MPDLNSTTDIATLPSISGSRNSFTYEIKHATTFNVGEICPFYFNMLVEPGDTISIDMATIIRTTTMKFPSFDDLYAEIFWFKQDWNNLYAHTKELMGENRTGAWTQTIEYALPNINIPAGTKINTHHILAHIGWPIQVGNYAGTKMGVDFYNDICNEYFNNQTIMPPVLWSDGDEDITYSDSPLNGGKLRKAAKLPDYFNTGVPQPQKSADGPVRIPLGNTAAVIPNGTTVRFTASQNGWNYNNTELALHRVAGGSANDTTLCTLIDGQTKGPLGTSSAVLFSNPGLQTDLSTATAAALNTIRIAAVQQQIYEGDAYFGTRAREIIKSRWGVYTSAETLHIPEYLGGTKFNLETYQVAQTSQSTAESDIGDLGAYSETGNIHHAFTKSFDFWGCIMGLVVVRYEHTYAQGLPAQFSKRRRLDFHWPEMDHLGFTATYNREIYMTGNPDVDNGAFNYRPIFQEYRYERSMATGEFNPSYQQSLDYMLYVDDYDKDNGEIGDVPVFSQEWIEETPTFVDRTLAYNHTVVDQIKMVSKLRIKKISKLAQYGLPGLTRF